MKKFSFILMSFAIVIGLTQCKKKLDTVNPTADGKVYITYSTGASKTNITEAGIVTWTEGDICHVYASTTGYLGSLTLSSGAGTNSGTFTGSISEWTDDETLRFYYLGNNTKKSDNTFVIDYSAQDGTLATIASKYHVACYTEENVLSSKTSFNGQMLNQMALAVFDVSGFGSGNVKIYAASGFRNQITISDKGVLSYGVAGVHPTIDNQSGHIVIGAAGAEKYVALLPSDGEISMQFTSQSKTGSDDVVSDYVDMTVSSDYVFTVTSWGTTVKFAKGNLVYDQGRFKMHSTQHGRCFTEVGNVASNYKVSGTFDLFGWGTAGWNNGNLLYMPYTYSESRTSPYSDSYGDGYGPTDGSNYRIDLKGTYANSDWGVYQFGMDSEYGWRTLSAYEWGYVINETSEEFFRRIYVGGEYKIPFGLGEVMGQTGLILLPDAWDGSVDNEFTYGKSNWSNVYTELTNVKWSDMEAAGAVFLPLAGQRYGNSFVGDNEGYYWSSSAGDRSSDACGLFFYNNFVDSQNLYLYRRIYGQSVRLVLPVE